MASHQQFHVAAVGGFAPVIPAPAEIDITTRERLHAILLAASRNHATVIVDLSRTSFCDSTGVNVLMRAWRRARAYGGELLLAGVGEEMARILSVMGVASLFIAYDRVEDALRSLRPN